MLSAERNEISFPSSSLEERSGLKLNQEDNSSFLPSTIINLECLYSKIMLEYTTKQSRDVIYETHYGSGAVM